jgi:hypothetical protein
MSCCTVDKPGKKSSDRLHGATLEVHTQRESLLNQGLAGCGNLHRATLPHFHCQILVIAILALFPVSSYRTSFPNWVVS